MRDSATKAIDRPRIADWLANRSDVRIRVVTAPFGFGKTCALDAYVRSRANARNVPIECVRDITPLEFATSIAEEHGEIVIDGVVTEDSALLDMVFETVFSMLPHARFIIGSRSREVIKNPSWFIDGTAEVLCGAALAFDPIELAQVCKLHNVAYRNHDVEQLIRDTDGWPMVTHAVIRHAQRQQLDLAGAYESWLLQNRAMLRDAVASHLTPDAPNIFSGSWTPSFNDLRELERKGLFVIMRAKNYALLRPVSEIVYREEDQTRDCHRKPMRVDLLGEFNVRIHGKRVEWLRRKDAQLFKFLLLSPGGTATRVELTRVFWPHHDAPQARQNLRTTCSNIRAALRECAHDQDVDQFFSSDAHLVTVNTRHSSSDLFEFNECFASAKQLLRQGMSGEAVDVLRAAKSLYRGQLNVDPPGAFYQTVAHEAERRFEDILSLISEVSPETEGEESLLIAQGNHVAVGDFTPRQRPNR